MDGKCGGMGQEKCQHAALVSLLAFCKSRDDRICQGKIFYVKADKMGG